MYYDVRNPQRILDDLAFIIVHENEIKWKTPLSDFELMEPFNLGIRLETDGPIPIHSVGKHGSVPLVWNHFSFLVCHRDMAEKVCRTVPNRFQLFETSSHEEKLKDLCLLNVTQQLDCIDYHVSDVDINPIFPDRCSAARNLVFKSGAITPNETVFKAKGALQHIIATEAGRQLLIQAGMPEDFFWNDMFEGN